MVAKSYQELKQLTEPYLKNNKYYVDVETKSGKPKTVRFYSRDEYLKMYPEERNTNSLKLTLGFSKDYITVYSNITKEQEDYFLTNKACRKARYWGWYTASDEAIPEDLPQGVKATKLFWSEVGNENGTLKEEVKKNDFWEV